MGIVFFVGAFIILYIILSNRFLETRMKQRLASKGKERERSERKKYLGSVASFVLEVKNRLVQLTPDNLKRRAETMLNFSGLKWHIADVLILKLIFTMGFAVAGVFFLQWLRVDANNLLLVILLAITGFLIPDIILRRRAKLRQDEIRRSLSPFIDYLTISVETGLGLDMAIYKVVSKLKGPLAEEMANTLTELKYGKSKKEAFRSLAERVNIPEFTAFLTALINGELLGVSLSRILRVQGQQIREKRKQKVQEKAYKIPIKLAIPLVLFIFPEILIILIGPAIINIYETLIK